MATKPAPHAPPGIGAFGWNELATRDRPAAQGFYSKFLGWTYKEEDMGPMGVYALIRHGGREIGGIYQMHGQQFEGVPPYWMPYVGVVEADTSAARAEELGGQVHAGPMDIHDVGRMAVIGDPTGAVLALFQSKGAPATDSTSPEPGFFCWNELATKDGQAAERFYTGLFGWKPMTRAMAHGAYTSFLLGERPVAGMMQMTKEWGDVPSHWMGYVSVTDCDAAARKVAELKGSVCVPPTDIPEVGRFAVVNDPTGATFSIIKLLPQPGGKA